MHNIGFHQMGLKNDLLRMIDIKGFQRPTPIQEKTIPLALEGYDIMGQAQTGTGKTASFGIPILNNIVKGGGLQALVVCPTRELSVQVAKEIAFLGKKIMINVLPIYGGQPIEKQISALKGEPEIVVGTPGRLLDHLQRRTISLASIGFLVLDEADEMLDMGFLPDIESIMAMCPEERQTFLFSATLGENVRQLGRRFLHNPREILIKSEERSLEVIEQRYYDVVPRLKFESLCSVLDSEEVHSCLVFCRTKKCVGFLAGRLELRGYNAQGLHGDMSQRERDMVMNRFRKGQIRILVATDLAARGLDISQISHVINYDIPEDCELYIHRIGRTGRAGRRGIAMTLVEPGQKRQLRAIEHYAGKHIKRYDLPGGNQLLNRQKQVLNQKLLATASTALPSQYRRMAEELSRSGTDLLDLLAASIKMLIDSNLDLDNIEELIANENTAHAELPYGRVHGLEPRRLSEFLQKNTSLTANEIGDIEINNNTAYIEVPICKIDEVYQAMGSYRPQNRKRSIRRSTSR